MMTPTTMKMVVVFPSLSSTSLSSFSLRVVVSMIVTSVLFLLLLLLSSASAADAATATNGNNESNNNIKISIKGKPINVWSSVDTLNKCGIIDVPDIPARVFADANRKIHMIEGSTHYHEMIGSSILKYERNCNINWDMTGDYNPSHFDGNEFLDSTWAFENGTVISLIHTEYPGDNYDNCDLPKAYPHCWTVSIGLAISYNWGFSWEHYKPPPGHLIATVPYKYNQTQLASGWGDPSNIIQSPINNKYYFAIWNRNQVGLQSPGICIMQNIFDNLLDPNAWRGWNGTNYSIRLDISPYYDDSSADNDNDSNDYNPSDHICHVIKNIPTDCSAYGISYSEYLSKFIMTLGCPVSHGERKHQFYISYSDDLVEWTDIISFYDINKDLPPEVYHNVTSFSYPVFLDAAVEENNNRNFDKIGKNPYLFWVSLGHSPYTDGRNLWATPMEFTTTITKLNNDDNNDNDGINNNEDDDNIMKNNNLRGNDSDNDQNDEGGGIFSTTTTSTTTTTTATDTK